ncbi:MAG: hypothetical protein V4616_14530 [Bacteroidota bacterium]
MKTKPSPSRLFLLTAITFLALSFIPYTLEFRSPESYLRLSSAMLLIPLGIGFGLLSFAYLWLANRGTPIELRTGTFILCV